MLADERLRDARLEVCGHCPLLLRPLWQCNPFEEIDGRRGCGCFVKLKARLESESCPTGQW